MDPTVAGCVATAARAVNPGDTAGCASRPCSSRLAKVGRPLRAGIRKHGSQRVQAVEHEGAKTFAVGHIAVVTTSRCARPVCSSIHELPSISLRRQQCVRTEEGS
jgi:hypothetical protein